VVLAGRDASGWGNVERARVGVLIGRSAFPVDAATHTEVYATTPAEAWLL